MNGAEFRQRRTAMGWIRGAVAAAIGVNYRTVQHWERGTRKVPLYAEKWLAGEEFRHSRTRSRLATIHRSHERKIDDTGREETP